MTDSENDTIYPDDYLPGVDTVDMSRLHGTHRNIISEDSAYSSQENDAVFSRTRRSPSPTIVEKYQNADPFRKVTIVVAHWCIHEESIGQDPKEHKIYDAGNGENFMTPFF